MKYIMLIHSFLCCLCINSIAQTNDDYTYKYSFHLDYANEVNQSKSCHSISDKPLLKLEVKDKLGFNQNLVTVTIEDKDTIISKNFGLEEFVLQVRPGKYKLTLKCPLHKEFKENIEILEGKALTLKVILGRTGSLTVYDLHSKKSMNESEINEIKKCLELEEDVFKCKKKGMYYVLPQI